MIAVEGRGRPRKRVKSMFLNQGLGKAASLMMTSECGSCSIGISQAGDLNS